MQWLKASAIIAFAQATQDDLMFQANHFNVQFIIVSLICAFCATANPIEAATAEKKDPLSIYRNAGVNTEQETKIKQIVHEYEKAGRVRVERLRNLSKQIKDLSYDAELDESKILGVQSEINELQSTVNTERTKLMLKLRSVLTAEQKEKFVDLMREGDPQAPAKKAKVEAPKSASDSPAPDAVPPSPSPAPSPAP